MWIKLPAYSGTAKQDCYLLQKGTFEATTGKWYGIQLKDRTLTFAIDDGITKVNADVSLAAATTYDIFNKGWVHIVALRDKSINRIRLYVNNTLAKSVDESTVTGSIGKSDNLLIGNSAENKAYPDSLDDVRMYNYALSEPAISKLFNGIPLLVKPTSPVPADKATGAAPERVSLGWTEPTGTATSYKVYFGTSPDTLKLKGTVTSATLNLDSLKVSANYYWKVEAITEAESVMGDIWMFTTGTDLVPPTIVTKPATAALSATGTVTITAADVNNGSNDVYGVDSLKVSPSTFTCANLGDNTVTLTARDKNGNFATGTAVVTITGIKPGKPATPGSIMICNETNTTLTTTSENAVTYQWLYENVAISGATKITYNSNKAGKYRVMGVSAQSCKSDTSDAGTISINSDTTLTISRDTTITRGASVELKVSGSEGTIQWSPSANLFSATARSTVAMPPVTTRYMATLTNAQGCQVSRYTKVTVQESDDLKTIYTHIITPNGDGINDRLVIDNAAAYPNNMLQIFDQSGKKIYEKTGYSNEWDARLNGRIVANGTYYFVFRINNEVKIKGSVTVVH
jgi:gliding motility-associated-like protein